MLDLTVLIDNNAAFLDKELLSLLSKHEHEVYIDEEAEV